MTSQKQKWLIDESCQFLLLIFSMLAILAFNVIVTIFRCAQRWTEKFLYM